MTQESRPGFIARLGRALSRTLSTIILFFFVVALLIGLAVGIAYGLQELNVLANKARRVDLLREDVNRLDEALLKLLESGLGSSRHRPGESEQEAQLQGAQAQAAPVQSTRTIFRSPEEATLMPVASRPSMRRNRPPTARLAARWPSKFFSSSL